MELYQLRTFVAVAEENHLTRAAHRLNTSQPSVSAHIKALENEFGVPLFKRSKKGMHLTGQGKVILEKAKTVVESSLDPFNQAEKLKGKPMGEAMIGLIRAGAGLGFMERSAAETARDKGQVALWQGKPLCVNLLFAFLETRRNDPVIEAMHRLHDTVWENLN